MCGTYSKTRERSPRFTDVTFSDMTYLDPLSTGFPGDEAKSFYVTVLTSAELNALTSPPSNPFTFTADVTMTNDEGETASGTFTFSTTYVKTTSETTPETTPPSSGPATTPTIMADLTISAPPLVLLTILPSSLFENAGTDPKITDASLDGASRFMEEHYDVFGVSPDGRLYIRARQSEHLSTAVAAASQPLHGRGRGDDGQRRGQDGFGHVHVDNVLLIPR